jgi:hypothetical protein
MALALADADEETVEGGRVAEPVVVVGTTVVEGATLVVCELVVGGVVEDSETVLMTVVGPTLESVLNVRGVDVSTADDEDTIEDSEVILVTVLEATSEVDVGASDDEDTTEDSEVMLVTVLETTPDVDVDTVDEGGKVGTETSLVDVSELVGDTCEVVGTTCEVVGASVVDVIIGGTEVESVELVELDMVDEERVFGPGGSIEELKMVETCDELEGEEEGGTIVGSVKGGSLGSVAVGVKVLDDEVVVGTDEVVCETGGSTVTLVVLEPGAPDEPEDDEVVEEPGTGVGRVTGGSLGSVAVSELLTEPPEELVVVVVDERVFGPGGSIALLTMTLLLDDELDLELVAGSDPGMGVGTVTGGSLGRPGVVSAGSELVPPGADVRGGKVGTGFGPPFVTVTVTVLGVLSPGVMIVSVTGPGFEGSKICVTV